MKDEDYGPDICWICGTYAVDGGGVHLGCKEVVDSAVVAERERCAQIAERGDDGDWSRSTGDYDAQRGKDIARVIRQGPTVPKAKHDAP